MTIFSRRTIQSALDSIWQRLEPPESKTLLTRLNSRSLQTLSAEWEVVLFAALSQLGTFRHEANHGGAKRPDVYFELPDGSRSFVADIRAVSDLDAERQNPIEYFRSEVQRVAAKLGVGLAGFNVVVESDFDGQYPDRKARLLLPKKADIPAFIKRELKPFLIQVGRTPEEPHSWTHHTEDVALRIEYEPEHRPYFSGNWLSYSVPYSLQRTPVYRALQKKAEQLRKSGWSGLSGVFLCDAGCSSLAPTRNAQHYGCSEIVERFFEGGASRDRLLCADNPRRDYRNYAPTPPDDLTELLGELVRVLPAPRRTPENALHLLEVADPLARDSHYGGYTIEGETVRISARTLVQLLAGTLDQSKFLRDHAPALPGFLRTQLREGRTLAGLELERASDRDDDWVILRFADDPAISDFRAPSSPDQDADD